MSINQARYGALAERYAKALFASTKSAAAIERDLEAFGSLLASHEGLARASRSPRVNDSTKAELWKNLAKKIGADTVSIRFITLLARRGRLDILPLVSRQFHTLHLAQQGKLEATVTSAKPLSAAAQKELAAALGASFGKTISLHTAENSDLLGGFQLRVGSILMDYSLAQRLKRLQNDLKSAFGAEPISRRA